MVELLRRYSNHSHLVKPLVNLLKEINSVTLDCNKFVTNGQDASAYGEGSGLDDPEAQDTLRDIVTTVRQKQHRLNRAEIKRLVARYEAGARVKELAAEFEVERRTVSAILQREGVPPRQRGLNVEQVDEAVQLYGQSWSLARIGEKLGVEHSTVRNRLRERGVRMRDTHGRER
jgi:transposase